MTITFNNNNQTINGTFCCPEMQNNDIIVQSNIKITGINKSDVSNLWGPHGYTIKFVFYNVRINNQSVANGINISLQGDPVVVCADNGNGGVWNRIQNKIDFTLGDKTPKTITYSIKVDCGNIDRRKINSISFEVAIRATGFGLPNGEVNIYRDVRLTPRFNCADCGRYYENLFQIDAHQDILFTEPVECDIATIDTNGGNQANGNANFPVIAVNDIPKKQISLDGVNFQQIGQFPYTYRDVINNVGKYTLTYKTGLFLCFNNGINVERQINVLDANNKLSVTLTCDGKREPFEPDANGYINLGDIIMPPVGSMQEYRIVLSNKAAGTPANFINHKYGLSIINVVGADRRNIDNNELDRELNKIEGWTNNKRNIKNDLLIGNSRLNQLIGPQCTNNDFVIRFDSRHLGNIKVEDNRNYIDIRLKLTIFYCIVKGKQTSRREKTEYYIIGRLFRRLPDVHHSIDFGTSAIVACKRENGIINIIDLENKKTTLFDSLRQTLKRVSTPQRDEQGNIKIDEQGNTIYEEREDNVITEDQTRDNSEPDSRLIASSMARREGETVDINTVIDYDQHGNNINYYNEPYWFSPTSNLTHVDNHLPCLKNLVGIDTIGNGVVVRDVITDAYKQLCKYFLSGEQIESLALTIPNTFNSVHKQQLENIIYDNIKTIARPYTFNGKEYSHLSFISESDSVLYSYIYNKIRGGNAEVGDEYIFVYDMGAGTLDITYAKCSYVLNNQHRVTCKSVEILGRSGINKAGNYIDYLLGEIIQDLLNDQEQKGIIEEILNNPNNPDLRKILKSYLRNSVKTSLNNDTKGKIPCEYYDDKNQPQILKLQDVEITGINKITIGDIINHKRFRNFVDDCTTSLLKDFRSVYGENDTLKVNTVVVSGRTVEINAIRGKIKKFFGENVSYCRIDGRDFDGNNGNNNNNNGRTLKTAVAEGALAYMDYEQNKIEKRPIYGHYGIIYQDLDGDQFIYGTTGNNPNLIDGILIGFYRDNDFVGDTDDNGTNANGDIVIHRNINVGHGSRLLLYHSYYNIATISGDIRNNRLDKISILSDSGPLPPGNYGITLTIHADHTLEYVAAFGNIGGLQVHADLNSDTLRKSIWPCYI